jgi:MATE family multidrug resistance protein
MTLVAASDGAAEIVWYDESEKYNFPSLKVADEHRADENVIKEFNLWEESKSLLGIAVPAVAVQFSVLFIFPLTASVVGRSLGKEALAGFSLGSLVGNLTCLSVMVGALTAADTLMPRAYAAGNFAELGRLAIRAFIVCSLLLVPPVVPLYTMMEWIFDKLGQDVVASNLASQWIKVYLLGVPAMLMFRVVQSFLNAQHKVWPLVYSSLVACFLVHPIFLKIFVSRFEFIGSSLAICLTQYVMIILLLASLWFFPVHKKGSWPGLSMAYFLESISPQPVMTFVSLSLGGVLSLSEWWFWYVSNFCIAYVRAALS